MCEIPIRPQSKAGNRKETTVTANAAQFEETSYILPCLCCTILPWTELNTNLLDKLERYFFQRPSCHVVMSLLSVPNSNGNPTIKVGALYYGAPNYVTAITYI